MIHRRGGATTSLILGIAGVIGVGVAGGMALTGTTPCSILTACGVKPATPAAQTVALEGEKAACPVGGQTAAVTTVAQTSDSGCCPSEAAEPVKAQTVALAAEACSEAKTDCSDAAKAECTGAATAQTVALTQGACADAAADCSNDPECAVDDGIACSTKGSDCHKVQPAADTGVQVQVVTATNAEAEVCAMAASCSPANCTEGMMKACTDSGKICPEDKSATPSTPIAQTVANEAKSSCCASKAKAETIAVAPDALRPLLTLQFSGKGMPMLIPASMTSQSACETAEASSCGGEAKAESCSDEKKADCASATTAALN